jgi:two-component sensor histidine kinase
MVTRVREQGFAGQLWGASNLGRLTEHDGVLIVDADGIIRYMSSVAENQYRRVGYVDSLVGVQISELETSEYICFQSIEGRGCLEQRIKEGDQIWIKRAIPVFPPLPTGFLRHLNPKPMEPDRAAVFIQDITEEVRREQELKIKSAMIQEVHHRVKNNLQTVAFLLRMQARRSTSGAVRETLRQTISRVLSIAVVHEFLSRGDGSDIRIRDVCSRIAAELDTVAVGPRKRVNVAIEGPDFSLPTQQATSCALVMNELLQNAVEHGFMGRDEGSITIRLREGDASMVIEVIDDGVGLPPDFDPVVSSTLGLQIVQTLVRDDLHGQLEILNGRGVTARMSFPKELCRPV